MNRNRFTQKPCANVTAKKCDAAEVMLTFSAPLPQKLTGVPSQRDCACVLGVPCSTLSQIENALIEKRRQLSAGMKGIYWALAKRKKGYYKIDKALRLLLVAAINGHHQVIVSPNAKDMLQLKNTNKEGVGPQGVNTGWPWNHLL